MNSKIEIIKIKAKKPINPPKIPGAKYVINQYIGCQYACKYCYARFMCKWYNYGKWGSWVVVKENLPDLIKNKHIKGKIYMSSVSDAYRPIEKDFKLTRNILKNIDKRAELSILTKSDLVLRDMDLFKKFSSIEVGLTINNFEGNLKKDIEPFSPSNEKRIDALKTLYENGIKNYAFISPIIPDLIDVEYIIGETKPFTNFYYFEFLNLKASREFKHYLEQNYPESYEIISNKTAFKRYIDEVINTIKKKDIAIKGICVH